MKKMIIAYRVLAALGVVLFLIGLVNLALDYQLGSVQLLSVLLATGGIVCTGFASIMVDHCKILAKTAWLTEHERKHKDKEPFYKPNLIPMDFGNNEEDGSKATCLPLAFINGCEVLVNPKHPLVNRRRPQTNEEKDQQHLAHLIRKGTKGFTE